MEGSDKCLDCGRPLPEWTIDDSCPSCLLRWGVDDHGDRTTAETRLEPIESFTPWHAEQATAFGEYELISRVARGGMGMVYKARQTSLNRIVAIKILLGGNLSGVDAQKRFRCEAESAASLRHPNIVRIHDVGERDGFQYLSMDYIDGPNLGNLITENGISFTKAADLVRTVAGAIEYAHRHGILHRDLKPSNIVIDGAGTPHVTDFGLAKQLASASDLTHSGQILGSPNYMPPEQAEGRRGAAGPAGDIYSMGAILYHLLTGRPPFIGGSPSETLHNVVHQEVVAPRTLNPQIPRDLETICLKCLQKDPKWRYETALELGAELDRFLRHEPIQARPIGSLERMRRWCYRKPTVAGLIAGVVVLFLLGFTGTLWQLMRVRDKSAEIQQQLARLNVLRGFTYMQDGDYLKSLLWFTRALALDRGDKAEEIHRIRVRSVMEVCPRLVQLISHDEEPIASFALSPISDRVATVGADQTARVWDLATGAELVRSEPFDSIPYHVNWSSDGRFLLVALLEDDGTVVVLNATSGQRVFGPVVHEYRGAWNSMFFPAFDPMSAVLLTQTRPRTLQCWHVGTGEPVGNPMQHNADLARVQFSRRDRLLWVTTRSGMSLWQFPSGDQLATPLPPRDQFRRVFMDPNIDWMLVGDRIQRRSIDKHASVLIDTRREFNWADFSPDGTRIATASIDRMAQVWDLHTGKAVTAEMPHQKPVVCVSFSPDGRNVISTAEDGTVRLWDADRGQPQTPPISHEIAAGNARFSASCRYFVTVHPKHFVYVWELPPQPRPPVLLKLPTMKIGGDAESGGHLLSLGNDGMIGMQRTAGRMSSVLIPEHLKTNPKNSWFDETGRFVIVEGDLGKVQIWDRETGLPVTPQIQSSYTVDRKAFQTIDLPDVEMETHELMQLSELLSGSRLEESGRGWSPLELQEVLTRWHEMEPDYSDLIGSAHITIQDWHRGEAERAEALLDWWAAGFHWDKLREADAIARQRWDFARKSWHRAGTGAGVSSFVNAEHPLTGSPTETRNGDQISYTFIRQVIPLRFPQATEDMLDLGAYFNGGLPGYGELPRMGMTPGIRCLGTVNFDLRGTVNLLGEQRQSQYNNLWKQVTGLKINRFCKQIHFLHRTNFAGNEKALPAAYLYVNYTDGTRVEQSLDNGIHLADAQWNSPFSPVEADVAWIGTTPMLNRTGSVERVYRYSWPNPHPEREIRDLAIRSAETRASYQLFAITVDPL